MIPKSENLQRALRLAVDEREIGTSWEKIAPMVKRKVKTVKKWPRRNVEYWQRLQRDADIEMSEEMAKETIFILRKLFRDDVPGDKIKSANLLIRLILERQKIDLRAMQAGLLIPYGDDRDSPNPQETNNALRRKARSVRNRAKRLERAAALSDRPEAAPNQDAAIAAAGGESVSSGDERET